MTEAYDGPRVVGMDLHRRRSGLVAMTGDGRKLGTARITNSPGGTAPADRPGREVAEGGAGGNVRVVLGRRTRWPRPARRCTWRTRWA
jgi:hypothetical protein